jgi:glycosyltransferase involved in cell wall biosynthesis
MNTNSPFFTVIIPTFNRPIELRRAVLSVLSQTFTDFEILIVNNGDIAVTNDHKDERIKLLTETRKGANYARNTGIDSAKGNYICFLDDDDEYLPNHLQVIFDLIDAKKGIHALYRTFTRREISPGKYADQTISLCKKQEDRLECIMITALTMHNICLHKEITKKYKFDPTIKVAQDYHMWLRILTEYPMYESPEITTIYHYQETSTSSPDLEKYYLYVEVYSALFSIKEIGSNISRKIKRKTIFKYYFWILQEFKEKLSLKRFIKLLFSLFYYKPSIIFTLNFYKQILLFFKSKFRSQKELACVA